MAAKRSEPERVDELPDLPVPPADAHKGSQGHVLVLAGSFRYTGAAVLTARASLRSGCGLVTLGCPKSAQPAIASHLLCEISFPLPDVTPGVFAEDGLSEVLDLAERVDAAALGPGISTEGPALAFARGFAAGCPLPTVIDGDGLSAFADEPETLRNAEGPRVLTPHPGEAARLLGCTIPEIGADRVRAAIALADRSGAVVALKGAGTIVTDGRRFYVNRTGNPGMATAGSGDVLTGVLASLLAQGLEPFDAAVLATHLHGLAGDLAAEELGRLGMIASDVLDRLPRALKLHVGI